MTFEIGDYVHFVGATPCYGVEPGEVGVVIEPTLPGRGETVFVRFAGAADRGQGDPHVNATGEGVLELYDDDNNLTPVTEFCPGVRVRWREVSVPSMVGKTGTIEDRIAPPSVSLGGQWRVRWDDGSDYTDPFGDNIEIITNNRNETGNINSGGENNMTNMTTASRCGIQAGDTVEYIGDRSTRIGYGARGVAVSRTINGQWRCRFDPQWDEPRWATFAEHNLRSIERNDTPPTSPAEWTPSVGDQVTIVGDLRPVWLNDSYIGRGGVLERVSSSDDLYRNDRYFVALEDDTVVFVHRENLVRVVDAATAEVLVPATEMNTEIGTRVKYTREGCTATGRIGTVRGKGTRSVSVDWDSGDIDYDMPRFTSISVIQGAGAAPSPGTTPKGGDIPEHLIEKSKVYEAAMKAAKEHELCEVVERTLKTIGIEAPHKTVKVTFEVKVPGGRDTVLDEYELKRAADRILKPFTHAGVDLVPENIQVQN